MLERQIHLARAIARLLLGNGAYELLPKPQSNVTVEERLSDIYMIVLFRAKDDSLNIELVRRMNATRKLYVSGTQWDGKPAARFAVANWQVDVERDLAIIRQVLCDVAR